MSGLVPKQDFIGLDTHTHLYTGAESPPLRAHAEALSRYLEAKSRAEEGREALYETEQRCRGKLAALLDVDVDEIALVSNASEALNLIANVINWRPGDNVVINDLEYPSVVRPWLRQRAHGVEVRVAEADEGGCLEPDRIAHAVDGRTRVLAVSHVSYMSGWRHDLSALRMIADQHGAILVVDATQSLGVVPVDAHLADFVVCSSYKWLLGSHGLGVLWCNTGRLGNPEPPAVGWRSSPRIFTADRFQAYELWPGARRWEVGFPSYPSIFTLESSLGYLLGVPSSAIQEHVLELGQTLIAGLREQEWSVLTSAEPMRRAGNVSFEADDAEQLAADLARRNIHVWGGDGRVRASIHLFNDESDIRVLLAELAGHRQRAVR